MTDIDSNSTASSRLETRTVSPCGESEEPRGLTKPERPSKPSVRTEILRLGRAGFHILIWTCCTIISIISTWLVIQEFLEDMPATVSTYEDPPEYPDPINIRLCNTAFLDSDEILNHQGEFKNYESYKFLHRLMSGNATGDKDDWILSSPIRDYYLLSTTVLEEFKLDIGKFVLKCLVTKTNRDCLNDFQWKLDDAGICYTASIDLKGYGSNWNLGMWFYFDPSSIETYTSALGAYGNIFVPGYNAMTYEGFMIAPGKFQTMSGTISSTHQTRSFKKSKCVDQFGLNTFTFTGEPFQTLYSPASCADLCYMESLYEKCQCSFLIGWNITKTECFENSETRACLMKWFYGFPLIQDETKRCRSRCISQCEHREIELTTLNVEVDYSDEVIMAGLVAINSTGNSFVNDLLRRIDEAQDPNEMVKQISRNVAQLTFYLKSGEPIKHVKIIPMMTLSTFLGNVGGLVGMWLGVSAISLMELLENAIFKIVSQKHFCPRELADISR